MRGFITAAPLRRSLHRHPGQGFVLLEVLVSLTVFAVGIMAVLTAVLSALNLQKDASLRLRAGLVLQDKLAETFLIPYDGSPASGLSADGLFRWTVAGETWAGAPQITDDAAENPTSELVQVAVAVNWESTRGTRSLTATQLVRILAAPQETP